MYKDYQVNSISARDFVTSNSLLPTLLIQNAMNVESNNTTFIHHVLFYLNNPNSLEDRALLIKGLEALAKIPCIQFSNIGAPAGTTRSVIEKKYNISWLCVFDSAMEEKAYQDHPIHDEFRTNYHHLWEKVVIYDSVSC